MKTFLILGGGTAGTMMANSMSKKLDPHDWKVVLVDKDKNHYYQPGFLFIPFGTYTPQEVVKPKTNFFPSNVEVIWSEIIEIKPDENKVVLAEDDKVISYDILVVATGVDIRPDQTENLDGAGWYQNIFDFYTYEGSVKLAEALKRFEAAIWWST